MMEKLPYCFIFVFFRCFVVFQLFLILHFLNFVEFQPTFFSYIVLIFWTYLSLMFLIKVILIKTACISIRALSSFPPLLFLYVYFESVTCKLCVPLHLFYFEQFE